MKNIFNTIFNTLVRDVDTTTRVFISLGLFMVAVFSLIWSIRKKNDKAPIAWGWMTLCVLCMIMVIVYAVF